MAITTQEHDIRNTMRMDEVEDALPFILEPVPRVATTPVVGERDACDDAVRVLICMRRYRRQQSNETLVLQLEHGSALGLHRGQP